MRTGDMRYERSCPLTHGQVIDRYFMEHRAKLVDIAAFLDRVERASDGPPAGGGDARLVQMRQALGLLIDGQPQRARRVLECFSDPTRQPVEKAPGKGAVGAYVGEGNGA